MQKNDKPRKKTGINAVLALSAVLLIAISAVGTARAALVYSTSYSSGMQLYDIGVALVENGNAVAERDYDEDAADGTWTDHTGVLLNHLTDDEDGDGNPDRPKPGKVYDEELKVRNNGTINQYVRVSVYRYWLNQDGIKDTSLSPELIDLHLLCEETGYDNGWHIDEDATTRERTALYYDRLLGSGKDSEPFSDTLTINRDAMRIVSQEETTENGHTTIETVYDYDGATFMLEAQVDAVQEHNASDAARSAWGVPIGQEGGSR